MVWYSPHKCCHLEFEELIRLYFSVTSCSSSLSFLSSFSFTFYPPPHTHFYFLLLKQPTQWEEGCTLLYSWRPSTQLDCMTRRTDNRPLSWLRGLFRHLTLRGYKVEGNKNVELSCLPQVNGRLARG